MCFKNISEPLIGRRENKNGHLDNYVTWYSKKTIKNTSEAIGSGLINLNLIKERADWQNYSLKFVGIYSKNSLEYLCFELSCGMYGFTSVALYDTLGEEATTFMFEETRLSVCLITWDHVKGIIN